MIVINALVIINVVSEIRIGITSFKRHLGIVIWYQITEIKFVFVVLLRYFHFLRVEYLEGFVDNSDGFRWTNKILIMIKYLLFFFNKNV